MDPSGPYGYERKPEWTDHNLLRQKERHSTCSSYGSVAIDKTHRCTIQFRPHATGHKRNRHAICQHEWPADQHADEVSSRARFFYHPWGTGYCTGFHLNCPNLLNVRSRLGVGIHVQSAGNFVCLETLLFSLLWLFL